MNFKLFMACVFGLKECMNRGDPSDVWGPPLLPRPPVPRAPTDPTPVPTAEPSPRPTTPVPTVAPGEPSANPTIRPTRDPTTEPTCEPTLIPTRDPTFEPTVTPTREPTFEPTVDPTNAPTVTPTASPRPTRKPTFAPTTRAPTVPPQKPSASPTRQPTFEPTRDPTREPTRFPTREPTRCPTRFPTREPTRFPTRNPTPAPVPTPAPKIAHFTRYQSYPMCCRDSPNYDPRAPTIECTDYSGCVYQGDLPGMYSPTNWRGHVSLEFIKTHNSIAFYDNSDPYGKTWRTVYSGRIIQLTKEYQGRTYIFNASILNTCGNHDCNWCCARNSHPQTGYLVDMEYYTVLNNFGTLDAANGNIEFIIF